MLLAKKYEDAFQFVEVLYKTLLLLLPFESNYNNLLFDNSYFSKIYF